MEPEPPTEGSFPLRRLPRGPRALRSAVLAATLLSLPALALEPDRPVNELEREVWGPSQGLPQNTVNTVVQTRDGYLWLGTYGGLSRFDGVRFVTLSPESTPGLTDNRVRCLAEDAAGDLWIGTDNGLSRLSRGRATPYRTADGPSSAMVICLAAERDGAVWWAPTGASIASAPGASTPRRCRRSSGENGSMRSSPTERAGSGPPSPRSVS